MFAEELTAKVAGNEVRLVLELHPKEVTELIYAAYPLQRTTKHALLAKLLTRAYERGKIAGLESR